MKKIKLGLILSLFLFKITSFSQLKNDSSFGKKIDFDKSLKFNYKQLIIPTVLISYGIIGQGNNAIRDFNYNIRSQVLAQPNHIGIDDYIQYLPAAINLGLSGVGVMGKHNFKYKLIITATAALIMGTVVTTTKYSVKEVRPDDSTANSFPSGHTANAFMGAELLYQEYKDVSPWYGISGYIVAASTGVLRIQNNRHWLTDVAAGAGIGILSAKAAYWLFPTINKIFTKNASNSRTKTAFLPYYDGKNTGFGLVSLF